MRTLRNLQRRLMRCGCAGSGHHGVHGGISSRSRSIGPGPAGRQARGTMGLGCVVMSRRSKGTSSLNALRHPKFVDFKLSDNEALEAVNKWLPALAPTAIKKALQNQRPIRAFLPFWTHEVEVHTKFRGEIGLPETRPRWDDIRNAYDVYNVRNWRETQGWLDVGDRHFPATQREMQVYAGFTFRRQNVQALKGDFVRDAVTFDPRNHSYALEGATVFPFEMTPDFAWSLVRGRINDLETDVAESVLKQYYAADAVRHIRTRTTVLNTDISAVYLPAYIFTVTSGNRVFRTFVSGVTGHVGGQRIYSSLSLGTLASVVAGTATSLVFPEPTTVAFAAGLPGVVTGALTKMMPGLMQKRFDERLQRELDRQRHLNERALDEGMEYEHRTREAASQARADSESIQKNKLQEELLSDPEGLYAALGLGHLCQNASLFEIKEHFRRTVLPVYLLRSRSAAAQSQYDRICQAYRRLRNKAQRAEYDSGAVEARRKELQEQRERQEQARLDVERQAERDREERSTLKQQQMKQKQQQQQQ